MPSDERPHFDVHPSVVYQLGESLITDAVQAIIELVKNCYDADATYAKVIIDTEGKIDIPGTLYMPSGGRIIVEDDGHGMDLQAINSGWLLISNRSKKALKEAKKTTPGGRTPLGDKGLGRLGVQRLGENLDIFTKCAADNGYHLAFSWLDFATAPTLQDVDIHLENVKYSSTHGTKVVISTLKDIEAWRGQVAVKRLEQELARMISPYKQIRNFAVMVEVDGKALELLEISDKVRDLAPVRYAVTFDGRTLSIKGCARLDHFRPNKPTEAETFALMVESDDGMAFFRYLSQQKLAASIRLERARSKRWFVEFSQEKALDSIDKLEPDPSGNGVIANPGSFTGEVDSFDLASSSFGQQSIFDRLSEYRSFIKDLSGIRVYRDGFAIRVDQDWLKLGAQWTSAASYYGLKPDNTLGYFALSARDNMDLEETTDREGFKDTPYFRNFYALLMEFKRFTSVAHEFFGRSSAEFRKKRNEEIARVDSRKTVEDMSRTIKNGLAAAGKHQRSLEVFSSRLDTTLRDSRSVASRLATTSEVTPDLKRRISDSMASLQALLDEASTLVPAVTSYLQELSALKDTGQVLEDRIDSLRRQIDDMYETVALGLTAEALSHEAFNIADQLSRRAKSAQTQLRNKQITDRTVLSFLEYVQSAVMALRKQISFLSPSLRYVREKRDVIRMDSFLQEFNEFCRDRLARNNIAVSILSPGSDELVVRMNTGKLTQIIDNFVLNSEYWLKEDIAQRRIASGIITFDIKRPFLHIWDNGRGVDPSVEHTLFEPFVSAKGRGLGRGLGLFIVKQLLDSEQCHVGLLSERNAHRRLFKFQIDFRGALDE